MNSQDFEEILSSFDDLKISLSRKNALGKIDRLTVMIVFTLQSFKNRKEKRKALREKIEEKRKNREKTEKIEKKKKKKHHRHKKRKKNEKENEETSDNDKYVEDTMRKRKKKKRKHKREKNKKKDSDKEVIDLEEVDNMQWDGETFAKEYNMEEESVLVIDENVKSPVDQICDSETVDNGTIINLVQNSNICDENLTALDALLGNAGHDKSEEHNKENMDFENYVADKTAIPGENSEKMFEAEIINDADKLKRDVKIELDDDTNVADVRDGIYGEKPVDIIVKSDSEVQSQKNLANQDFEENTNTINPKMVIEEKGCFQSCEENDNRLEAIVSKSGNNSDDDTSNIAATESKKELEIIDLKHYDVTEESIGASGSADNSIVISSDSESEMESGELTESESSKTQSDSHDSISSDSSPDSDTEDSDSVELVEEEVDWSRRNGNMSLIIGKSDNVLCPPVKTQFSSD